VSRYAEYEALGAIGSAYEAWTEANTRLDEQMGVAAAQEAAPPVDALEADFAAGVQVTRAVIAFARTCPTGGPHLDDLTHAWAQWLPVVGRWTPASTQVPPPRPTSPVHSHVLATVDAWWEAEQESMRERLVGALTKAGGELTGTSVDVGPDGQMIENTHIRFRSEAEPAPERGGVMRRIRGWVGGRRP
jgi:hypothetical protein